MADELAHETVRQMYTDGKLTAYGRRMSKFLERALPDDKVDEWGWNLSRKERAEIKRQTEVKRSVGNGVGKSVGKGYHWEVVNVGGK